MAHCVISAILDTDVDAMVPACIVHTAHAPCMHDGEPANPAPLHAFNCAEREDAIRMWRIRTHRQRPLIIHDERRMTDPADHVLEDEIRPCPCGAEVLAAEAPGAGHERHPLAAYMALAAAPFGSGLELFALVAFIVRPGRWCPVTGYMIAAVLVSRAGNALRRLAPGRMARIEREWRDVHGMPRRHPESLTRALRRREERRLAALRAELWPDSYEAEL